MRALLLAVLLPMLALACEGTPLEGEGEGNNSEGEGEGGCVIDDDCGVQVCQNGVCVDDVAGEGEGEAGEGEGEGTGACVTNADCAPGEVCYEDAGSRVCGTCLTTDECDPGDTCEGGVCTGAEGEGEGEGEGEAPAACVGAGAAFCLDGLFCNGVETCDPDDVAADADGCAPGDAVRFADAFSCTDDSCAEGSDQTDNAGAIVNLADDTGCGDDLFCTVDETCAPLLQTADARGCTSAPRPVDDANACTADGCDEAADAATHVDATNDDNACTVDVCDPATGVTHTPVDADDDNACTVDSCDPVTGDLVNAPINLDDDNICTTDTCDSATGAQHTPIAVDDDAVACTVDECDAVAGQTHTPDDALCAAGEVCDPVNDCIVLPRAVITELRFFGTTDDAFELLNVGTVAIDVAGLSVTIDGVTTTPTSPGSILPGARATLGRGADVDFVFAFDLPDTGGALSITADGRPLDSVTIENVASSGTPAANAFVASPTLTTQLDAGSETTAANDVATNWCLSFRAADSLDAGNHACAGSVVINEVRYDFESVASGVTVGGDDNRDFVELAGPGGASLVGLRVAGIEGDATSPGQEQAPLATLSGRLPLDGFFVIADGAAGVTDVPNADLVLTAGLLENGPDGVRLFAGTVVQDAFAYGAVAAPIGEGTPVALLASFDFSLTWARDGASLDTNNNAADFHYDPTPTPGLPNDLVLPRIVSLSANEALVGTTRLVTIVAVDVANLNLAANRLRASSAGSALVDCVVTDTANQGAGATTMTCTAPARSTPLRGDVVVNSAPATGLAPAVLVNGWTYLVSDNGAVDFCNLQSPTSLAVAANVQTGPIFGQVFEAGVTDTGDFNPAITAELGFGPDTTNPTTANGWTFATAVGNPGFTNPSNDEYMGTLLFPTAGSFRFTYRFSLDGGLHFTYCDSTGNGSNGDLDGFQLANTGVATVGP